MTIWERIFGQKPETKEIPYDPADDLDFRGATAENRLLKKLEGANDQWEIYKPKHTGGWILDSHMVARPFKGTDMELKRLKWEGLYFKTRQEARSFGKIVKMMTEIPKDNGLKKKKSIFE